ncbi:MAG: serine hydrolase domain-containing protein [Acidimicrobiia bacterium]
MSPLSALSGWPVDHAAGTVVTPEGTVSSEGPGGHRFRIASLSKLLTAYATLVAIEEGSVGLDDPAGPPGATVRHLLAHTSGLPFTGTEVMTAPGRRRVYSNTGFEVLGEHVAARTGVAFAAYLHDAVFSPLGMSVSTLEGSPAKDVHSTVDDLARFAAELWAPALITAATLDAATSVAFPGLNGVLPGLGSMKPNDWGLGFELRGTKSPHWTGSANSPVTFGHFGGSGTFLWVDRPAGVALVVLTDRDFGPWSLETWPPLADAVLARWSSSGGQPQDARRQ